MLGLTCKNQFSRIRVAGLLQPSLRHASDTTAAPDTVQRKRLDVAIVGAPNAGKSQLLNTLTKSPVAAVSRKRHTTRTDILGARTIGTTQIVFKDTPGFLRLENAKEERLNRELIISASSEMKYVDYTLLVVDAARSLTPNYRQALIELMRLAMQAQGRIEEEEDVDVETLDMKNSEEAGQNRSKFAIVLNKVDLIKNKPSLLELAMDVGAMADTILLEKYQDPKVTATKLEEAKNIEGTGSEIELADGLDFGSLLEVAPIVFYVSALEDDGVDEIVDHLVDLATPCQSWAVNAGEATNMTSEEQVQELIREKVYRCLHKEVPHQVQQVNRLFRRVSQGIIIHQDLVVFTKSHHRLVLGTGGRTLQRIQDAATRDLGKIFGCEVALRLHVKLNKSKQRRNPEEYERGESSSHTIA